MKIGWEVSELWEGRSKSALSHWQSSWLTQQLAIPYNRDTDWNLWKSL